MIQFIAPGPVRRLFVIAGLLGFAGLAQGCVVAAGAGAGALVAVAASKDKPAKQSRNDKTLESSVRHALHDADDKLASRVGVTAFDGHVVLTGAVFTRDDRIKAAKVAWNVKHVKDVQNEIQVGDVGGPGRDADDAWISSQVRSAIRGYQVTAGVGYKVQTVNGVVYLMGVAPNRADLDGITDRASRVRGVKKVVSLVRVKEPERRTAER
jgi:osmotically-inducible protein OsmY